jgi:hypothetical protein
MHHIVIGREAAHDRARIAPLDQGRGEGEGRAGAVRGGLDDDVLNGQVGELPGDGRGVGRTADDEDSFGRGQLQQPLERLLQKGILTKERQEELWPG